MVIKPLPKQVRDKIRMTCALKGYLVVKTGKQMRLPDQYAAMNKFYHGKISTHPAQIKLLAEGHVNYSALYNEVDVTLKNKRTSNKTSKTSVIRYKLKDMVTNSTTT